MKSWIQVIGFAMLGLVLSSNSYGRGRDGTILALAVDPPLTFQDSSLSDSIVTLMQRYDISIRWMSDDIEGVVSGRIGSVSAADWLSQLGRLYNFYWYFDGAQLEIGSAKDVSLEMITIAAARTDAFLDDIDALGMDLTALPIDVNSDTGLVFVHGPESLQRTISQIAEGHQTSPEAVVRPRPHHNLRLIYGRSLDGGS